MNKIVYLTVGDIGERFRQKDVFSRRWQKKFEQQKVDFSVNSIGWLDVVDSTEKFKELKESYSSHKLFVMYNLPEDKTSNRIFEEVGQNKYLAGQPYITGMENLLNQVHEKLSELDSTFLHSPETFIMDKDKRKNYKLCEDLGIPTPETQVVNSFDEFRNFFDQYNDVYLKPIAGTMGRGITRVTNYNSSKYMVMTKANPKEPLKSRRSDPLQTFTFNSADDLEQFFDPLLPYISLVQRAINPPTIIENKIEMISDLRFLTISPNYYEKILTAGLRVAPKQQILANLSAGGREMSLETLITKNGIEADWEFGEKQFDEIKDATFKLAEAAKLTEIGADFMFDQQGKWYSIEINGNPGYKTGYFSGMTLGDYGIMGPLIEHEVIEDFVPQLKDITYEDILLDILKKQKRKKR
jgi:hypothetical protein